MTLRRATTTTALTAGLALAALAGCDSRGAESTAVGRNATVELRPFLTGQAEPLHKQRSGTIRKLTADWVVVDENGIEIWIPRDAVLEIRFEKK